MGDIHVFGSRAKEVAGRVRGAPAGGDAAGSAVDIPVQPIPERTLDARDRVRLTPVKATPAT